MANVEEERNCGRGLINAKCAARDASSYVNCVDVEGMDGSSIFLRLRKSNGFAPEGSILYIFSL